MHFRSVGVIGLGYVGLPLAKLLTERGLHVIGVDVDARKVEQLQAGTSYISDLTDEEIRQWLAGGRFQTATDCSLLAGVEAIIICVPTPINGAGEPVLDYIQAAGEQIEPMLGKGQLVVLESSTYPGTTEDVLLPLLQKGGKTVGNDFYLAYSPERINPGDRRFHLTEMPKIISGVTAACLEKITALYSPIYEKVVPVSSPRAAEMAKVAENSQRFVNISFVNEMARFCEKMHINVWEVIDAINTKPYGNLYFYPGPGVGGHCIPVDPLYLQWKAQQIGSDFEFIAVAKKVNDRMPDYIVSRLARLLGGTSLQGRSIFVVGVAYKKDVNDIRESSAMAIMESLIEQGARVVYHDPHVPHVTINGERYDSAELTDETIRAADCVLLLVDHSNVPIDALVSGARLLFDTRNATGRFGELPHVIRL